MGTKTEGHEPTSSTITSLVKFLAEMPHVYRTILQEQREIAKLKKPGERLKPEDIRMMKYSWSVVSEVIRLVPPVIGAFRLLWSPTTTNSDPAVFPREKDFDPTRFHDASPPSTYVPFGGGPRMCLGKNYAQIEILVFLHHVVNMFHWELMIPGEKIKFDPLPIPSRRLPWAKLHLSSLIKTEWWEWTRWLLPPLRLQTGPTGNIVGEEVIGLKLLSGADGIESSFCLPL
ncbi:hypothetical protein CRG98_012323 [Punica granatum]|uniref:Uncharacterized protein n=1 Tax=Punica granatum TaxID=22663 RepID=A0A2I0KHM1_PUNGR|nr:hypothetical protein CRG98_012323 [Punica granatum]